LQHLLTYMLLFHYHRLYWYEWFCHFTIVDSILLLPHLKKLFLYYYYYYYYYYYLHRHHYSYLGQCWIIKSKFLERRQRSKRRHSVPFRYI
jgi:hypothetical protein